MKHTLNTYHEKNNRIKAHKFHSSNQHTPKVFHWISISTNHTPLPLTSTNHNAAAGSQDQSHDTVVPLAGRHQPPWFWYCPVGGTSGHVTQPWPAAEVVTQNADSPRRRLGRVVTVDVHRIGDDVLDSFKQVFVGLLETRLQCQGYIFSVSYRFLFNMYFWELES